MLPPGERLGLVRIDRHKTVAVTPRSVLLVYNNGFDVPTRVLLSKNDIELLLSLIEHCEFYENKHNEEGGLTDVGICTFDKCAIHHPVEYFADIGE